MYRRSCRCGMKNQSSKRSNYSSSTRVKRKRVIGVSLLGTFLSVLAVFGIVYVVWVWESANAARPQQSTYTITITDTGFHPTTIHGTTGSSVKIHVKNQGRNVHNFIIPAYYIFSPNLRAGESTDIEFTPDKKGTFPYYSDAPGTKEPGFIGNLIVR
jgi:uncharacterized cupredoxin-like copper-binding protein